MLPDTKTLISPIFSYVLPPQGDDPQENLQCKRRLDVAQMLAFIVCWFSDFVYMRGMAVLIVG